MLRNALSRYTSIRSSSASGTTGHRPLEGKAKSAWRNRAARLANKHFLPRIQKLSPLCTTSLSVKRNVTFAGTNALPRYTSSVGYADTCLAAARAGAGLGSHREPIQYRAPASQPSRGRLSQRGGIVPRGLQTNIFCPEYRNFLRCA